MMLFRFLLPVLAAASSLPGAERVMFVGDSITHGVGAGSYRWPLHRLWVDNGMSFEVVGVHVGNHSRGIVPGTEYGGVAFNNRHSAMCSERAYEIAGRSNTSGRLGNSNIFDWLGLDASYTGKYRIEPSTQTPDMFFILIGTNDALGENALRGGIGAGDNLERLKRNMLGEGGDMDTIIGAMRRANPKAHIVVLSIPGWHDTIQPDNTAAADFAAVLDFNREYARWAKSRGVIFVDISSSLRDYTRADKPGVAVPAFLQPFDHLHPSPQGDLLIAGAVAQKLGWPGATAGLPRREVVNKAAHSPLRKAWSKQVESAGFTCRMKLDMPSPKESCCGEILAEMTCGSGHVQVLDCGIRWGCDKMLCAGQMGNLVDVTVAYVAEPTLTGATPGYYVWWGDRLIGEALPGQAEQVQPALEIRGDKGIKVTGGMIENEACAPCTAAEPISPVEPHVHFRVVTWSLFR